MIILYKKSCLLLNKSTTRGELVLESGRLIAK